MKQDTTILPDEIEKFTKMADEWWNPNGKFKPLHIFNPVRIDYLKKIILSHFDKKHLMGLKILDVGCGGGLLSEPFARMGAQITGIDAAPKNIEIAKIHADKSDIFIDYQNITAEALAETQTQRETFDVIFNMEVIEHVASPELLLESCAKLLKPNGVLFVATLNRTLKSFALAIVGAEYILRWLPVGTHDWNKFLKPAEIQKMAKQTGLQHQKWQGVTFHPISGKWSQNNDLSVNYMGYFTK